MSQRLRDGTRNESNKETPPKVPTSSHPTPLQTQLPPVYDTPPSTNVVRSSVRNLSVPVRVSSFTGGSIFRRSSLQETEEFLEDLGGPVTS